MKILTVIFSITILFNYSYGDDNFDFRKTKWGMTESEVKASMTGDTEWKFDRDIKLGSSVYLGFIVIYKGYRFGVPCELKYSFDRQDKLYSGGYRWEYEDIKILNAKGVYKKIENELIRTYGPIDHMAEFFKENDDIDDYFTTYWKSADKRTHIMLRFYTGGENKADIVLTYIKRSDEVVRLEKETDHLLKDLSTQDNTELTTYDHKDTGLKTLLLEESFYIILALICGCFTAIVSYVKGNKRWGPWFLWGLLFGPLALIFALFLSGPKCPKCQSRIHKDAQICPKCRSELQPQEEQQEQILTH